MVNAAAIGYGEVPIVSDRDAVEHCGEEGCNTPSHDDRPHYPQADCKSADWEDAMIHEEYRYLYGCDIYRVHQKAPVGSLHVSNGL